MKNDMITVRVRLTEKLFRDFALFDAFSFGKRWRRPAVFSGILIAFAVVCAFSGKSEAWLLTVLLALMGLGMPAVYVGTYLSSVKKQAKAFGLDKPRLMYTVTLTGNNVTIHNEYKSEADVTLPWEKIYGAVRVKEAVYLYAVRTRAFILPDGQSDGDAWALLKSVLPQNKLIDRRK